MKLDHNRINNTFWKYKKSIWPFTIIMNMFGNTFSSFKSYIAPQNYSASCSYNFCTYQLIWFNCHWWVFWTETRVKILILITKMNLWEAKTKSIVSWKPSSIDKIVNEEFMVHEEYFWQMKMKRTPSIAGQHCQEKPL